MLCLFPSPQFDFAHADPDSQRGAFELVAAALNGKASLPRQTGAAARPALGGGGTIVRIDAAFICPRGPVRNARQDFGGSDLWPPESVFLRRGS